MELNYQNYFILLPAPHVTQYVNLIHIFSIFIHVSKIFSCLLIFSMCNGALAHFIFINSAVARCNRKVGHQGFSVFCMAVTCVSFINNVQIYLSTYAFELFSFQVFPVESAPVSESGHKCLDTKPYNFSFTN